MISRHLAPFVEMSYPRRRWLSRISCWIVAGLCGLTVGVLFLIFGYVLFKGFPALNLQFFLGLPKPVGEAGGGMANAILGTFFIISGATVLGVPWGILAGVYLSEYGRGRLGELVRFSSDMLASVPSIVLGLFAYAAIVVPMGRFSAVAASLALAVMMIPTIARNTEELLKLVPSHIREAGLALGISRWKVIMLIVLRGSLPGILTGVMLAIARAAGETAPLLFTALGFQYFQWHPDQPMASLPVQIFTYAISPFEEWHRQAWAGALVLVGLVLLLNILARAILRSPSPKMNGE